MKKPITKQYTLLEIITICNNHKKIDEIVTQMCRDLNVSEADTHNVSCIINSKAEVVIL